MKVEVGICVIFGVLRYTRGECASFTCSYDYLDSKEKSICGYSSNTSIEWGKCLLINSKTGESYKQTCCTPQTPALLSCSLPVYLPGDYVQSAQYCHSKQLNQNGKTCWGKSQGARCSQTKECNPDLVCEQTVDEKYKVCNKVHDVGENCGDNGMCVPYAICINSTCVMLGSIENGLSAEGFVSACVSHFSNRETRLCAEGWELKGEHFINEMDKCDIFLDDVNITDSPTYDYAAKPLCGYRKDGLAICQPGPKQLKSEYKTINNFIKKIGKKTHCHHDYSYSEFGVCNRLRDVSGYASAVIAITKVFKGKYYLDNLPGCVGDSGDILIQEYSRVLNGSTVLTLPIYIYFLIVLLFMTWMIEF